MPVPDEMEHLLDDLVDQIVEEAMTQVVQDTTVEDWKTVLTELRDLCRRRIQEAADNLPVDDLRVLFSVMVDRAVKVKVEEILRAFPQVSVDAPTPN